MLHIASINSGSNGNCYYVGNNDEAVLIDVGISCREVERRMHRLDLSLKKVKAVFISHEHVDHIRGVQVLAGKYRIPVYITAPTLSNSSMRIDGELVRTFSSERTITIGKLTVTPFSKHHDAIDPYSFIVEGNDVKVGVLTDIGHSCEKVVHYFKQCHAAFLESNYDEQMLDEGDYPIYLKNRIRSGKGHLSNKQALDLFITHRADHMSHLLLSHLSKNNNDPELVYSLFSEHANNASVVVASRYQESPVYIISANAEVILKSEQMSLF